MAVYFLSSTQSGSSSSSSMTELIFGYFCAKRKLIRQWSQKTAIFVVLLTAASIILYYCLKPSSSPRLFRNDLGDYVEMIEDDDSDDDWIGYENLSQVDIEKNKVPFRLISYFDLPMKWLNQSVNASIARLAVNRYGSYEATLRDRDLVILIPTVLRPKTSYLISTIENLLQNMNSDELQRVVILVSINEISEKTKNFIRATAAYVFKKFPEFVSNGTIEIISPPRRFYMDISNEIDLIGDPSDQFQWRSKQVVDYMFLFTYVFTQNIAKYALLIEDDVHVTEKGFVTTMLDFPDQVRKQANNKRQLILWYEFHSYGAFGRMFPRQQLPTFFNVMTTAFYAEPVDWLMGHVAELFACRYHFSKEQCEQERNKLFKVFPRSLFRHVAKVSTSRSKNKRKILS